MKLIGELKWQIVLIILLGFVIGSFSGCASYNAQTGAAVGGSLGAIAGQLIGGNAASTWLGAGIGAGIGALTGNAVDQYKLNDRLNQIERKQGGKNNSSTQQKTIAYASTEGGDAPPGEWREQKGKWVNGQWVPKHRVWQPIDPEED